MNRDLRSMHMEMPSPSGEALKTARLKTGLSQVEAAALMGYGIFDRHCGLASRILHDGEFRSDVVALAAMVTSYIGRG